jgi:hypothetical protein
VIDFADGPSLAPAGEARRARRAARRWGERVAATVPVVGGERATRAAYRAWRREAGERLAAAGDPVAWALAEACSVAQGGAAFGSRGACAPASPAALLAATGPLLPALARRLAEEADDTARVYAAGDLQTGLYTWAAAAAAALEGAVARGDLRGAPQRGERLVATQQLHVHGLLHSHTLAVGLFGLGLRLLLARAGGDLALDGALLPVSSVELLHRTGGMGALVDDHAGWIEAALGAP